MFRSTLRRLVVAAASATALATVAVPSPALAGDFFFSKASGTTVTTSWLETGWFPKDSGVPGNAHFGQLFVEDLGNGRASVFGIVHDVRCDVGVTPYNPGVGGHGEEPPADGPCRVVLERFIEGATVRFTIDSKLTRATLTGTLAVSAGHGTGPTGTPAVNITWTGVGSTYSSRESGTFTDETGSYTYRYAFTGRRAAVGAGSKIGPMVFDDEKGEWSEGELGKFRGSDRQRS